MEPSPIYAYIAIPLVLVQLALVIPVDRHSTRSESNNTSFATREQAERERPLLPRADADDEVEAGLDDAAAPDDAPAAHVASAKHPERVAGAAFIEAITSLDFWLAFCVMFIGSGSGLVTINNLGQITQALGGGPNSQNV